VRSRGLGDQCPGFGQILGVGYDVEIPDLGQEQQGEFAHAVDQARLQLDRLFQHTLGVVEILDRIVPIQDRARPEEQIQRIRVVWADRESSAGLRFAPA